MKNEYLTVHEREIKQGADLDDIIHNLMNLKFDIEEHKGISVENSTVIFTNATSERRMKVKVITLNKKS